MKRRFQRSKISKKMRNSSDTALSLRFENFPAFSLQVNNAPASLPLELLHFIWPLCFVAGEQWFSNGGGHLAAPGAVLAWHTVGTVCFSRGSGGHGGWVSC